MRTNYLQIKIVLFLLLNTTISAQHTILFDASKAQSAGNADWIIDADLHNISYTTGPAIVGGGSESNPQRFPTPLQSTITASTPETYWQGALSYWAIDCVKKGYTVETLPYNGLITYGNVSNVQDLSNYKAFIIDEPNIVFTTTEKTAIINFVANGGGLFMIADHTISDRNNDGIDSPQIFNDLMTTNTVQSNPFGISFDYVTISQTSSNVANLPSDPLLHGTTGNVTQVMWSAGTTMTLNTTNNPTVKGVVFKNGASTTGLINALCAYSTYGNGKIAAIGDSSIPDDGTGDTGDTLYDGYITDAAGNHQRLLMNTTNWLMSGTLEIAANEFDKTNLIIAPNPTQNKQINLSFYLNESQNTALSFYDSLGRAIEERLINNAPSGTNYTTIDASNFQSGIYVCKITTKNSNQSLRVIVR